MIWGRTLICTRLFLFLLGNKFLFNEGTVLGRHLIVSWNFFLSIESNLYRLHKKNIDGKCYFFLINAPGANSGIFTAQIARKGGGGKEGRERMDWYELLNVPFFLSFHSLKLFTFWDAHSFVYFAKKSNLSVIFCCLISHVLLIKLQWRQFLNQFLNCLLQFSFVCLFVVEISYVQSLASIFI